MMCIDAMEMIPPEDWQAILGRFRRALRRNGLLYLTVERHAEELVRNRNEEARRRGLPVVDGEVLFDLRQNYRIFISIGTARLSNQKAGLFS